MAWASFPVGFATLIDNYEVDTPIFQKESERDESGSPLEAASKSTR
jgi:hypothetical protein